MENSIENENLCVNCLRDFGDEQVDYVWSNIFEKEICEYCDLEIGLEFQEGFGEKFTQKAVKQSGHDIWEVKKRYLQQMIGKIEKMLDGGLDGEERDHLIWNLVECKVLSFFS